MRIKPKRTTLRHNQIAKSQTQRESFENSNTPISHIQGSVQKFTREFLNRKLARPEEVE